MSYSEIHPQHSVHHDTLLGEYPGLTDLGKRNAQLQPPAAILARLMGEENGETLVKVRVQRHILTKALRPNHRATGCSLSSPSHVTKGLLRAVIFTWYIMSKCQEKLKYELHYKA